MAGAVTTAVTPELIARRRAVGIDLFDEVWDGVYHVAPGPTMAHARVGSELAFLLEPRARERGLVSSSPFNVGEPHDYRVPDGGFHRGEPTGPWTRTAAVVVEVLSPGDETYKKFGFYAAHEVDELIVADPVERRVAVWRHAGDTYEPADRSELLGITTEEMESGIRWPAI